MLAQSYLRAPEEVALNVATYLEALPMALLLLKTLSTRILQKETAA